MLSTLSTGHRFKLAIAFTAFAALCFALPPAVLAMGHGANTAKCLSHADAVNHGMAKVHDVAMNHDSADVEAAADHGDQTAAGDHQMTCCGLFCLSAVPASSTVTTARLPLGVPHSIGPATRLLSGSPILLERPPNTLLSA